MGKMSICRQVLTLKGALIAVFLFLALGFASCEKENNIENEKPVDNMEMFFIESMGLPETSMDSVKSFISKFSAHIKTYPRSQTNEYFNPTVDNMSHACSVFGYEFTIAKTGFLLETDWLPDTLNTF
jgi:hypothetical protein